MLIQKLITTDEELVQVAQLSEANSALNVQEDLKKTEGYVTWSYPLNVLRVINRVAPSVIVKDGEKVVGYAIVLTKETAPHFAPLREALEWFGTVQYEQKSILDHRVYFLGQTCIHQDYRGKGILNLLYDFHRQEYSPFYDIAVSEISVNNPRSKRAHEKIGFTTLQSRFIGAEEWDTVLWKLK
jgi:ribosomal protein S18 acetylase RimI-like enzyme